MQHCVVFLAIVAHTHADSCHCTHPTESKQDDEGDARSVWSAGSERTALSVDDSADDRSDTASTTNGDTVSRHPRIQAHAMRKLQSKWCLANSLNSKALGIAAKNKQDLVRLLRDEDKWSDQPNPATAEQVRDLFFAGFFLQVALKHGGIDYYSVGANQPVAVWPGSEVSRNKLDASSAPVAVCYHSILETSQRWMMGACAVELFQKNGEVSPMVRKLVPPSFLRIYRDMCKSTQVDSHVLEHIPKSQAHLLLGKQFVHKAALEKELRCSLEVSWFDVTATMVIWARSARLPRAVEVIQSLLEAQRADLVAETHEEAMVVRDINHL